MRGSRSGEVCALVVLAVVLTAASDVSAQAVMDGRRAEFTPSADHNTVEPSTGTALVQRYSLEVFLAGGTTPVSTADLGKPAPGADGMIRLDFVSLLTAPLTPGVVYEAAVSAVGPGGSAPSARSNTFAFSVPCVPAISPTAQAVAAAGGTGSSTVTVAAGCPWTAVSNAAWIAIANGATGSGSGTVTFAVAANTSTASRTGTLTIAGSTFTVTQAAAACAATISPASASVASTGNTGFVTVTAAPGCAWTAKSDAAWITITAGASDTGNGAVIYSVAANPGTTMRTGTLTIAGSTFTVTQAAAACAPTISPASASVASTGNTGSVTVTSAAGCAWSASSNAAWIAITAGATGSGNGPVTYSVGANTATTSRTGTLTVAGNTFTVNQAAAPCSFTISPTSQTVAATGGGGTVTVTTTSGCSWTATSGSAWITISGGAGGTGSGSVAFTAAANATAVGRTGTLSIAGKNFVVTQPAASCTFAASPLSIIAPPGGGTGTVTVTTQSTCAWTSAGSAWVALTGSATGSGAATYTISPNTGTSSRSCTIIVAGIQIGVVQQALNAPGPPTNLRIVK